MACFSATIWISNIQFFFGANQHSFLSSYFYIIPLLFFIFDLTTTVDLKIVLTHTNLKNILTILGKPGLCILFFILKIAAVEISHSPLWLIIEIPCLYILLTKASQFYKSFRVMSLSKKYEYHFKAFDLIFSLMQVAHVIVTFTISRLLFYFKSLKTVRMLLGCLNFISKDKIHSFNTFIPFILAAQPF